MKMRRVMKNHHQKSSPMVQRFSQVGQFLLSPRPRPFRLESLASGDKSPFERRRRARIRGSKMKWKFYEYFDVILWCSLLTWRWWSCSRWNSSRQTLDMWHRGCNCSRISRATTNDALRTGATLSSFSARLNAFITANLDFMPTL